jgi:predicted nucleic acid-binding protein
MDVMIDANIIVSAALFPNPRINAFLDALSNNHQLFICSYTLEEIDDVIERKFPTRKKVMEIFLQKLSYILVRTPSVDILSPDIIIPDKKDHPVMASAIVADVDVLITGDSDFDLVELERPEIMKMSEFAQKYL